MPHFIRHGPGHTPAGLRISHSQAHELPTDLLRDASRRLAVVGLIGAVLWVTGTLLGHLAFGLGTNDPAWRRLQFPDAVAGLSALVSLGVYGYARKHASNPVHTLGVAHGFEIFTAMAIGLVWHTDAPEGMPLFPMISWIGVVVLLFAAVIPSVPRRTLAIGFLAVSMGPLGMLIAKWRGVVDYGSDLNVLLMHYPDYLLVGVAAAISAVVVRLGQQVSHERAMGSYQLGELIGRGGMGEVYRATHRMLARPAAIKLIRPETLSGKDPQERDLAIRRFHREAETAASLRSPHTVALYDFGITEDETLYFVMELLEGMSLETLVRRHGAQPPARVIHILRQACESLEEAHRAGLVHRDIKPANLHLGRVGLQYDFVKVLDFGLVKSVKARSSESSLATELGMTPGTPDYMAPEASMGEAVDARADLYALGCVGYFLLTGQLVFTAASVFHVIARHLNDRPEPPSARAGIPLPRELDDLILRCLAKQPSARPQTAAELSSELANLAVAPWNEEQAAAWWSAHVTASAERGDLPRPA